MPKLSVSTIGILFIGLLALSSVMKAHAQQPSADLRGTWAGTPENLGRSESSATVVEVRIATSDTPNVIETLYFSRDDSSMELSDFGPGRQTEANVHDYELVIAPDTSKVKPTHSLEITEDLSSMTFRGDLREHRVSGVSLSRGPNPYACLERLSDSGVQMARTYTGIGNCGNNLRTCRVGITYWCCNKGKACDYDNIACKSKE